MSNISFDLKAVKAAPALLMEGMSPVEQSIMCQYLALWTRKESLYNQGCRPGTARFNSMVMWSVLGGCVPDALRDGNVYYIKGNLGGTIYRFTRECEDITILTSIEEIPALKEGDTVLVEDTNNIFNLRGQKADNLVGAWRDAGVWVGTVNALLMQKLLETEVSEDMFVEYLSKLQGTPTSVEGKTFSRVKITRYDSLDIRYEDGELEVLQGLKSNLGRNWYSFNGQPASKFKAWMVSLNYLVSSRSAQILKGRKAFMKEIFVDDVYVGKIHPLLAAQKTDKLGNLKLAMSKDPKVILTEKGSKEMMEQASRIFMNEGIPTFMHKAGSYLLVDDGARAAGVDIIGGWYHYWLEADKASKRAGGRHLHGVATAFSAFLENSGIGIRIREEVLHWEGVSHLTMRIQSPLATEGSGNFHYHPSLDDPNHPSFKGMWHERVYSHNFPSGQFGEALTKLTTYVPAVGDTLEKGDVLIGQKKFTLTGDINSPFSLSEKCVNVPHRAEHRCRVKEVQSLYNAQTSNLDVKVTVEEITQTAAEKYRGTSKGRGSSFCRNIRVVDAKTRKSYYNPTKELGEDNPIEFLLSDEEGKTRLQLAEMASHEVEGLVWNGDHWENEQLLDQWIIDNRKEVVITRFNLEPTVYAILKQKFGEDESFTWEDQTRTATHRAQAWMGKVVDVVETPLTHTFVGKTSLFGEVISYLGIEHPALYNLLLDGVTKNQAAISELYSMVGDHFDKFNFENEPDAEAFANPIILLEAGGTEVVYGKRVEVEFVLLTPEQCEDLFGMPPEVYQAYLTTPGVAKPLAVSKITIPGEEITLATLRAIQRAANASEIPAKVGVDASRFCFLGQDKAHVYRLDALARVSATTSHNISQNLIRMFMHLGVDSNMGTGDQSLGELRQKGGWESVMSRLQSMLQGAVKTLSVESNTILAKAARTEAVAFQCRAATTIDGTCAIDQALIHPDLAEKFGLVNGDTVLVGRNPMPKMGALKLFISDRAPRNTLMMNAFAWHAFNEGDADGDSVFFLAISSEGDLVVPNF